MRVKAKCSRCDSVVSLFFDDNDSHEIEAIEALAVGEYLEHKCPKCEAWAAFEKLE